MESWNEGGRAHYRIRKSAENNWYPNQCVTIGEKGGVAMTLTNLGELLSARGDLARSEELHRESLAINREIGDKAG